MMGNRNDFERESFICKSRVGSAISKNMQSDAAHWYLTYWLTAPLSTNDRTAGDPRGDSSIFCHVHSANKHFLEIG